MKLQYLWFVIILFVGGCQTVHQLHSYQPEGEEDRYKIEILQHNEIPTSYDLLINGEFVAEMKAIMGHHPRVAGVYKGKPILMRGDFLATEGFAIDVFVDNDRAVHFIFY